MAAADRQKSLTRLFARRPDVVQALTAVVEADDGSVCLTTPDDAVVWDVGSASDGPVVPVEVDGEIVGDLVGDLPTVSVDRERMIQVVINLISNARKFTDGGTVTVAASSRNNGVEFAVSDTGIGIPTSEIPRLFDRFHQVGGSLAARPTGSGLGLPICREIVTAHDGRIDVESVAGDGTTVTVWLPFGDGGAQSTGSPKGLPASL